MGAKEHSPEQRRYANVLRVRFNDEEVIMDYGQYHEGDDSLVLHTGIVATPQNVGLFARILRESAARWQRQFGARDEPHAAPGDLPAGEAEAKPGS